MEQSQKDIKHTVPVYDEKHVNIKVKRFNGVVNTNVWGDKAPKEGVHHTCITCISTDSVMKKRIIHKFI